MKLSISLKFLFFLFLSTPFLAFSNPISARVGDTLVLEWSSNYSTTPSGIDQLVTVMSITSPSNQSWDPYSYEAYWDQGQGLFRDTQLPIVAPTFSRVRVVKQSPVRTWDPSGIYYQDYSYIRDRITFNTVGLWTVETVTTGEVGGQPISNVVTQTYSVAPATPGTASVTLSNLLHIADGTAKSATVTTNPAGLTFSITYNGSSTPPSAPGSYSVVANITSPGVTGSSTAILSIVTLNLTYSSPTYSATPTPPTNPGSYTVSAVLSGSPNHIGAVVGTLVITDRNDPPSVSVSRSDSKTPLKITDTLTFQITASDPNANLIGANWSLFRDGVTNPVNSGSVSTTPTGSRSWSVPVQVETSPTVGNNRYTYTLQVTARDSGNLTATNSASLTDVWDTSFSSSVSSQSVADQPQFNWWLAPSTPQTQSVIITRP